MVLCSGKVIFLTDWVCRYDNCPYGFEAGKSCPMVKRCKGPFHDGRKKYKVPDGELTGRCVTCRQYIKDGNKSVGSCRIYTKAVKKRTDSCKRWEAKDAGDEA